MRRPADVRIFDAVHSATVNQERVTAKDIAKRARVSVSTAYRFLNMWRDVYYAKHDGVKRSAVWTVLPGVKYD